MNTSEHPIPLDNIQCIGFDADDTLWENECFYLKAEHDFKALFADKMPEPELSMVFAKKESDNMPVLGYGAKAMIISMIETAYYIDPNTSSETILKIIDIGKELLNVPTIMLEGAEQTIQSIIDLKKYRVIIITKGELNEQNRKFLNSPLDKNIDYFVLADKSKESYLSLLRREKIDPESFLMIGNSPRSDVLPPLEIGAWAAHIPFETTWVHEDVPLPEHPKLIKLNHISEILKCFNVVE